MSTVQGIKAAIDALCLADRSLQRAKRFHVRISSREPSRNHHSRVAAPQPITHLQPPPAAAHITPANRTDGLAIRN